MRRVICLVMYLGLLFASSFLQAQSGCDHTIGLSVGTADARGNFRVVQPGDVVCIAAGSRGPLTLKNFQGAASAPIVFRNAGGAVVLNTSASVGIKVQNCRYFRLTGTGDSSIKYGIQVKGSYGFGINIGWKSSDMEIDHIEIAQTSDQAGIKANTKSNCSDGSDNNYDYDGDGRIAYDLDDVVTQANFTQYNTRIHDNHVSNTAREGFYIGANRSVYASYGQGSDAPCPTAPTQPLNPLLDTVRIYNNIIERSGWDAMNIKAAYRNCQVYSNRIVEDSTATLTSQQGGIHPDLNSQCDIYNNFLRDGNAVALKLAGSGGKVYNNVIINAGRGYTPSDKEGTGIHVWSSGSGAPYVVVNNTIVNPMSYGVYFAYPTQSGNRIQNNVIVNPGAYNSLGDQAYISIVGSASAQVGNNYKTLNLANLLFTNPAGEDYSLRTGSPAIDKGVDLTSVGITSDRVGTPRPIGPTFDVGAYEFKPTASPPQPPTNLHVIGIVP
ncbi:MAG: choice-of-anchor Q domain-containing protein [Acidobacteriota bacterium]